MKMKYKLLYLLIVIFFIVIGAKALIAPLSSQEHMIDLLINSNEDNRNINTSMNEMEKPTGSKMEIHFLDVGQGDATLITCEEESLLIDAGGNSKATWVQNYLEKQKIKTLKYAIGTHPHEDHIGGLDVIITKFPVEHVLLPQITTNTRSYDDLIQALKYKAINPEYPKIGDTFKVGSASVTILSPDEDDYFDNLNNYSIILMVEHSGSRFLFSGDAEEEAEAKLVNSGFDLNADVYQVGHHGSSSSSSVDFIKQIAPDAAVISCGVENDYGHPNAKTLNTLRGNEVLVYRTDEDGTIILTSEKGKITFNVPASTTWQAGERRK